MVMCYLRCALIRILGVGRFFRTGNGKFAGRNRGEYIFLLVYELIIEYRNIGGEFDGLKKK